MIFFSNANSGYNTRGHCLKLGLFIQHCKVNTRKFFFVERVVEPWNMPASVQDFISLRDFKAFLKIVDFSTFLTVTLTNLNL